MSIKVILDEITNTQGNIAKKAVLAKYKDNETLKRVLYLAKSNRVKFFLKQIPEVSQYNAIASLEDGMTGLEKLSNRDVTGHDAQDYLITLLEGMSEDDAYIIERIIDKNPKIGLGRTYINEIIEKLIEKTPYQGAKSFSIKGAQKLFKTGDPVISQIKADGTYRNLIVRSGEVDIESRQGEPSYLDGCVFVNELEDFEDCVLNGELTIDGYDRYTANGMVSSIMDIKEKAEERGEEETAKKILAFEEEHGGFEDALKKMRLIVWDVISVDEYYDTKSDTPYSERLDTLTKLIDTCNPTMVELVETKIISTYAEAVEHFLDAQERGLEGTIIKSSTAGWKDGKPTYQIKMKLEMNMDLRIIGFQYGNEGTKNENVISTLLCETDCGILTTNPSNMKEKEMKYVTENMDDLLGTIVEIKCCGLSQNKHGEWSTMHPSVVEFRSDKNTCDSLESCKAIEEAAKTLETVS